MKLQPIIVLLSMVFMMMACGNKEKGIPFIKASQKISKTPSSVENTALNLLGKKQTSQELVNSLSSRAIRSEIIGIEVKAQKISNTEIQMGLIVSYDDGPNQCSRVEYNVRKFQISQLAKWTVLEDFGQVRCLMSNCKYLMLIIEHSPSAVANNDGSVVAASVPVILENNTADLMNATFKPTSSFDSLFLRFENDTMNFCIKPTTVLQAEQIANPVNPNEGENQDPNYDYFDLGSPYFF